MRSRTAADLAGRCLRCHLLLGCCLCDDVERVATRTHVLIVRHFLEALKTTNTARLALLALPNARIVDYGRPEPLDETPFLRPGTWLLFPRGEASVPTGPPPGQLIIVDGTWSQARRMVQRVPVLRTLPRLSLAPATPAPNLRRPHFAEGLSTLEALAEALAMIEGEQVATPLRRLHALGVERVLRSRGIR